jgi:hypothetical protein
MRWLMVLFLVSLAALILASAGIAWHIWRHHVRTRNLHSGGRAASTPTTEETPFEPEEAP